MTLKVALFRNQTYELVRERLDFDFFLEGAATLHGIRDSSIHPQRMTSLGEVRRSIQAELQLQGLSL